MLIFFLCIGGTFLLSIGGCLLDATFFTFILFYSATRGSLLVNRYTVANSRIVRHTRRTVSSSTVWPVGRVQQKIQLWGLAPQHGHRPSISYSGCEDRNIPIYSRPLLSGRKPLVVQIVVIAVLASCSQTSRCFMFLYRSMCLWPNNHRWRTYEEANGICCKPCRTFTLPAKNVQGWPHSYVACRCFSRYLKMQVCAGLAATALYCHCARH